ncbi:Gfo/Idh/MocA family protein [Demetria terragena]|uniref:Gfo/Idh/MocA family protein n=1 Tax=Demetria terragena TaxID=63959 RepID=UPI00036286B9|nr:Gfo/Idh/MocA family oxidoreductase [Demetria terragena]
MRIGVAGAGRIGAFHAATLAGLDHVEEIVVTDALPGAAAMLGSEHGYVVAADYDELLGRVDGVVITSSTSSHADLLTRAVGAGLPTFCEKPVALTLDETMAVATLVETSEVPVQIGFQRRFDAGYRRAHEAVHSGELGFLHTIRANTHDQSPPPAEYIPTSGGLFRDCNVHDFDILRFVTGREVRNAFGTGANKGADFFAEGGDVDTAAAVLTLDDDTLVTVSATRYNGGGHDVRMEVMGEKGTIGVGFDDSLAVRSAEAMVDYPRGPQKWSFMERFLPAYQLELAAFCDVVAGTQASPCTVQDALQAFRIAEACDISRLEGRLVDLNEIKGAA